MSCLAALTAQDERAKWEEAMLMPITYEHDNAQLKH